ncbi:hypothetical protein B0H11DRAFT_1731194 [Mycena galericulata]|nr:hypothetical protein B0H11DRAFT_1731194 [Mycena galericulata]
MRAPGSATAPRAKIPPDCIFIDLSDSPPPEPARTHHPPTSLSPTESKPSASQIRPKRKFTPSLPPSTAETPPSKRLKTLSGTVRPAHKHNVYWALDGSIVIQIQETKFKVHQSQLAKQSQWFSDLFEGNDKVASAKHVERSEDGSTPMYILSLPSLTARDFGRLLDALDRAITYVHEDPPFSRLAGILRAATILKFHDFRDWIVRLLEDRWSSSLTDLSKEAIGLATESIILARACDVPSILKRAMYELARRAGYGQNERDSGQGVATRDFLALVRAREELTAVWLKSISPYAPEFGTCAAAMAPAPASVPTPDAEPAPQPIPAACTTLDPLRSGEAQQKLVRESGIADDFLYDPLCGLQALIDSDWSAEGFCEACVGLRREVWTNTRERAWVDLDRWFGLEAT